MKQISFYFDFISPYSFLAWGELLQIAARNQAALRIVPVLLAGLLNAHGQKGPAEIPAKRDYVFKDLLRWCHKRGETIKGPPAHPFNPLSALRLCEAVGDMNDRVRLTDALFSECWRKGQDISDKTVLARLLDELGLDTKALMAEIETPNIKEGIKQNTSEAISRGVFGVPTFVVDNELFWGYDRLCHLEDYLKGNLDIDQNLVAEILARPRGADRKEIKST
jgi:2-hydroxychromene-2-carboxylate isomerase